MTATSDAPARLVSSALACVALLNSANARDCTQRSQCPSGQICDTRVIMRKTLVLRRPICEEGEICDLACVCRSVAVERIPCEGLNMTCPSEHFVIQIQPSVLTGRRTCVSLWRVLRYLAAACNARMTINVPWNLCNVAQGKCDSNVQCAPDPSQCPESPNVNCIICTPPQMCNLQTKRCEAQHLNAKRMSTAQGINSAT